MSQKHPTRKIMIQGGSTGSTLNDRFTQIKSAKIPHSPTGKGKPGKVIITRDTSVSTRGGRGGSSRGGSSGRSHTGGRGGSSRGGPRGGARGGARGGRGGRGGKRREKTPTKEELDAELDSIAESNQMKE